MNLPKILLCSLGAAVAAQDVPPVLERAARVASAALYVLDGVPHADGGDWRARFDAAGATFTPALGARALLPMELRLSAVSIARALGAPLPLAVAAPPCAGAESVEYARAEGIVERWRVVPHGLELSYSFDARPAGHGDLVVRIALAGEFDRLAVAEDGGVDIERHGIDGKRIGGVRIGGVTGVDANGARAAGSIAIAGRQLELRLPARFVDEACYPLLLDPLIGTLIQVAGGDDARADAAYDAASQRYLVVFERRFALQDVDVMGQRFDADGNPVGVLQTIRSASNRLAVSPRVANVAARGRFVVAWREGLSVFGPWSLECRALDGAGSASAITTLVASGVVEPIDIGGNATLGDRAIVAWGAGASVVATSLAVPAGIGAPTAVATSTIGAATNDSRVVVADAVATERWVILWSVLEFASRVARAQAVDRNAAPQGTTLDVVADPGLGESVGIAGDGSRFVAVYVRTQDVRCQPLRWNGSTLVLDGAAAALTADGDTEFDVAVAWLGTRYVVVWSDDGGAPFRADLQGIALDFTACVPCGLPFTLARPGHDHGAAIGAQRAAGSTAGDGALIVFTSADTSWPLAGKVWAQRFAGTGPGGPVTNLGGECGGPYTETLSGPLAIGNASLSLRVTDVSTATIVALDVALANGVPTTCGPCQITVPFAQLSASVRAGVGSVPLPVPCDPSLVGGKLEVQWLIVDPGQNPCPLVAGLTFSDRLKIEIGQ